MLNEVITAMMVEHERQLELRNKTIRDREVELALVVKDLKETRAELWELKEGRMIKQLIPDVAVPVKGLGGKIKEAMSRKK